MAFCKRYGGVLTHQVAWGVRLALIALAGCVWGCTSDSKLEWQQEQGYRWAEISPARGEMAGFRRLRSARTGIDFANRLTEERIAENRNLLNGSGVAAGDVDGDGLVDLYFARLDGPNRLYKNLGGMTFEDVTARAGVAHDGYSSTGVVFADVDGDGDLDLLATSLGERNTLHLNDGDGRFTPSENSGLRASRGSSTMALADIDGDGDLDLYVTNYKEKSVQDLYPLTETAWEKTVRQEGGSYVVIPPFDEHFVVIVGRHGPDRRELGTRDELYVNRGDGTFEEVSNLAERFLDERGDTLGLGRDFGLTARFQDLNGDRHPDLYVCNDFWTPDRVWLNRGDGRFKAAEAHAVRSFSFSSMAVDFSDINRDGLTDFFVSEMLSAEHETRLRQVVSYSPYVREAGEPDAQPQYMRNTLYVNRGDGTFAEVAHYSGVEATGWSWATQFLDVDLDGYEDLIVNTGHAYDVLDIDTQERLAQVMSNHGREQEGYILEYPPLNLKNVAYRNNGDLTFTDTSTEWGFDVDDVSHGMATADLDNDGDLDVVVNRLNDAAVIYRNEATAPRIAVRLKGRRPNTGGIGANVSLTGGPVPQQKEVVSGGGYLSGSAPTVSFAADKDRSNHVLSVTWPGGSTSVIDSVRANRIYEIEEPALSKPRAATGDDHRSDDDLRHADDKPTEESREPAAAFFEDVSDMLDHRHEQADFNDFSVQPLLPLRLSRSGPGIAWIDLDGDGDDDLLIGASRGAATGTFENVGDGRLTSMELGVLNDAADGDQMGLIGWEEREGTRLVVGLSTYEPRTAVVAAHDYSVRASGTVEHPPLPRSNSSTGPLAAADYDGDGDVDLFVGGRMVSGRYPVDAASRLFKNEEGAFRLDAEGTNALNGIGMVTDGVFTDVDGDGDQDLICTTEWGPIKLFRNEDGRFQEITEQVGLDRYRGWWNGIAVGDFNNDGRPDLVATNLGTNSVYQRHTRHPIRLYFGEFGGGAGLDLLEAYYEEEIGGYVPRRGLYELHRSISTIISNLKSHRQFARSTVGEILRRGENELSFVSINTLEHMLFINSEGGFEGQPLPAEAQWSAAFYAGVADFDNDGYEDVFITQNLFAVPPLTSRLDAGRGLWLAGNGTGRFVAVKGGESGIKIYGEQRGAALGDYDGDGRVDLAVSQNNGETKLYRNRGERQGLRIRLRGPRENRSGIGSGIRLIYADGHRGPRREVQSGSGYLSQNSTTHVLGTAAQPDQIEVTWFDGTVQTFDVSPGQRTYDVEYSEEGI